jgi:hypothetical protein
MGTKITQLPVVVLPLTGVELFETVQSGQSRKITLAQFQVSAGAPSFAIITGSPYSNVNLGAELNLKAYLDNPTFTGTPEAPTPAPNTPTGQIITGAYYANMAGVSTPLDDSGVGNVGSSPYWAHADHQHPASGNAAFVNITGSPYDNANLATALNSKANADSPTFTGIPAVPQASLDNDSTQAANTAWVMDQASDSLPLEWNNPALPGTSDRWSRADHQHPPATNIDATTLGGNPPSYYATDAQLTTLATASLFTGLASSTDAFILQALTDTTLRITAISGIYFQLTQNVVPFPIIDIPLATVSLPGDGIYFRYVSIDEAAVVSFSSTTTVESPTVCQLGAVYLKRVAGVNSFLEGAVGPLNVFTKPILASIDNYALAMTPSLINSVGVAPIAATESWSNGAGLVDGLSINWHNGASPLTDIHTLAVPADALMDFRRLHPGNAATPPLPAPVTVMDSQNYWNGVALVSTGGANSASVQRLMMTMRGTWVIQYGEVVYSDVAAAKNSISIAPFSALFPSDTFVEVARIAIRNGASDITISSDAEIVYTGQGGGGGGSSAPGSGVTSVTATDPMVSSGGSDPDISILAASPSRRGTMSIADFNKLGTIATGATANSTDVFLLARANHTGTQLAATISDFTTQVTNLIAATPINNLSDVIITGPINGQVLQYNGSNWVNILLTGGGSVTSVTGTAPIVITGTPSAIPNVTITAASGSAAGSMSAADYTKLLGIAANATANATDAFLLARANHTGTQLAATISDFKTTQATPRTQTAASSATLTPAMASNDRATQTAQAVGLTIANPTGSPVDGQQFVIRLKDNGTARLISYGTNYRAIVAALPTTTVATKTMYMGFMWNSAGTGTMDLVALAQEP